MQPVEISGYAAALFLTVCILLPFLGAFLYAGKLTRLNKNEMASCIHSTRACVFYSKGLLFSGGGIPLWKVYFFKQHLVIVLFGIQRIKYSELSSLKMHSTSLISLKLKYGPNIKLLLMQPLSSDLTRFNFYHLLNK